VLSAGGDGFRLRTGVTHFLMVPSVFNLRLDGVGAADEYLSGSIAPGEKGSGLYVADCYARSVSGRPGLQRPKWSVHSTIAAGLRDRNLAALACDRADGGGKSHAEFSARLPIGRDVPPLNVTKFNATVDHVYALPPGYDPPRRFPSATTGCPGPFNLQFRMNEGQIEL